MTLAISPNPPAYNLGGLVGICFFKIILRKIKKNIYKLFIYFFLILNLLFLI